MYRRIVFIVCLVAAISFVLYQLTCDERRVRAFAIMKATRDELGDAETQLLDCNSAIKIVEDEISRLRDVVLKKKKDELEGCKRTVAQKIDTLSKLHKNVLNKDLNIPEFKRKNGISF